MKQRFKQITSPGLFVIGLLALMGCQSDVDLASIFSERGVDGSILISSLDGKYEYQVNPERVKRAYLPASTFKIPNTLIALDEGVISDPDTIFKWDGKIRFVDSWNKDHSLRTAFPASVVWFYQELASRVGNEAYLRQLSELQYGNMQTGPELTTFWLDGDLRISSLEQITFLKKLYRNELPYKPEHVELLKELMIVEQSEAYIIRAKTGWTTRTDGQHGWYVGYLEKNDTVWFFATNIEITADEAQFRQEITMEALKRLELI